MKTVCKLNQCAGCKACLDICKKKAISIVDSLSVMNASIDENLCIDCGACKKVCPNNGALKISPQEWYQGWVNATRHTSSSGGVAAGLMESFIQNGGYVAACLFKMVNLFLISQMT